LKKKKRAAPLLGSPFLSASRHGSKSRDVGREQGSVLAGRFPIAQSCGPMTEELDIAGVPKTSMALRLLMMAIAFISLVPAGLTTVIVVLGVIVGAVGAGKDYLDVQSWVIVVAMSLLSLSTCVTAAVAAMSGDRRSTWIGIGLFVVTILLSAIILVERASRLPPKTPPPLRTRTAP